MAGHASLSSSLMIASNGFIYALQESHLPGVIICAILFLLSAFSWTVMITKFLMIHRARKHSQQFLDLFRRSRSPVDPYCDEPACDGSPLYSVYRSGSRELTFQLLGSSQVDETLRARVQRADKMSEYQMETVASSMDRAVGEVALRLESQMTLLATVVSGAPFLGLLGTVWGVMETFSGIAGAGAGAGASIQSMAPGVSAALVTTVIGLLVAIPAMFGYNFLINSIRAMIVRMDHFAAELTSAFHRHYVDHGRRFEALPSMTAMSARSIPGSAIAEAARAGTSAAPRSPRAAVPPPEQHTSPLPGFETASPVDADTVDPDADTAPVPNHLYPAVRSPRNLSSQPEPQAGA